MGRLQPRFHLLGPALVGAEAHEKLAPVDGVLLSEPLFLLMRGFGEAAKEDEKGSVTSEEDEREEEGEEEEEQVLQGWGEEEWVGNEQEGYLGGVLQEQSSDPLVALAEKWQTLRQRQLKVYVNSLSRSGARTFSARWKFSEVRLLLNWLYELTIALTLENIILHITFTISSDLLSTDKHRHQAPEDHTTIISDVHTLAPPPTGRNS